MTTLKAHFFEFRRRFFEAEIPLRAAGLAYHSLLALIPTLGLAIWYLQSIGLTRSMYLQAEAFIYSNLSLSASATLNQYLHKLTGNIRSQSWGWIGLIVLIYTVLSLLTKFGNSLDRVFNTAWKEAESTGGYLLILSRRFILLLGLPFSLAVSLAFFTWVRQDSWFRYIFNLKGVGSWIALPLPLAVDVMALCLIYKFVPQKRVPWREALRAAAFTSVFFELAKYGMGVYSRYAFTQQKIYGALSALPIFIIWVQLIWVIIMTGALLIRLGSLEKHSASKTD